MKDKRSGNVENENERLEKTIESGLIALIAIAKQIRDGYRGDPTNDQILEAKHLLTEIYTHVAG
jgi:hypothetical protein